MFNFISSVYLLMVAGAVSWLQRFLQEVQTQLVNGRLEEVILHQTKTETIWRKQGENDWITKLLFKPIFSHSPVFLDHLHKVHVAFLPKVFGAQREDGWVVHATGAASFCRQTSHPAPVLLLEFVTQRRLADSNPLLTQRTQQTIQGFRATTCRKLHKRNGILSKESFVWDSDCTESVQQINLFRNWTILVVL